MASSNDSIDLTLADREYILRRLQKVQEDLQAQLDALKASLMTVEKGHELEQRVEQFDANVAKLRHATAKATDEAGRLRILVARLSCLEPVTENDLPCITNDEPLEPHRHTMHSSEELEDLSEVTSATIKAIMPAVVDAVRKSRSSFPIQFSTPGGWAVKLSAVGAVIVALVFVGWWLLKHLPPFH